MKARNGVLDLVDDRLVLIGSSSGGSAAGQARGLVVDGLAGGLVVVGLEVSVMHVRRLVMMEDNKRQTWRRGRHGQWRAPW